MATNVDARLLKQTKFPPEFSQKVDMKKVNVEVMKKWIAGKISEILGSEDDVVIELCFNLLEGSRFVLQIQLTGFLDKDTPKFCRELWTLCLSAQSNPQGVPKELLEAKKLELIQEKVLVSHRPYSRSIEANAVGRLTPRKLPRKPSVGKSKNERETETLTVFGSGSGLTEDEVAEEMTEGIMTTIGLHLNPRDPHHHHDAGSHRTEATTVGLPHETTSILVVTTVLADPQRLFVMEVGETEGRGLPAVVVIELDPTHLQTRLAHDHPEDPEGDAVRQYHPAVPPLHQGLSGASTGTLRGHCNLGLDPLLGRPDEIARGLIDQEDLRLTLAMKWMIHALMLVKDEAIMTAGTEVPAASAVDTRVTMLRRKLQAEALAYRGREKERGVGP
ncbi:MAG: hypothetical protein Q9166_004467 [cf. Caloplaca sp. 2 TL-2023]